MQWRRHLFRVEFTLYAMNTNAIPTVLSALLDIRDTPNQGKH